MTDRDQFAAAALAGLVAMGHGEPSSRIASVAYRWADQMLTQRRCLDMPSAWAVIDEFDGQVCDVFVRREDAEQDAAENGGGVMPLHSRKSGET